MCISLTEFFPGMGYWGEQTCSLGLDFKWKMKMMHFFSTSYTRAYFFLSQSNYIFHSEIHNSQNEMSPNIITKRTFFGGSRENSLELR